MVILGIDPGYAIVGWGVIDYTANRFQVIAFGAVTTEAKTPFNERLETVYDGIQDIINKYKPDALAIEKLFYICYYTINSSYCQRNTKNFCNTGGKYGT